MEINQVTQRMFNLTQSFRQGKMTTEEIQSKVEQDVQGYLQLKNNNLIDELSYQSILGVVSEFEDIISDISDKQFKENGKK